MPGRIQQNPDVVPGLVPGDPRAQGDSVGRGPSTGRAPPRRYWPLCRRPRGRAAACTCVSRAVRDG